MKKISILGSTGSIGTQALDVIADNKDKFKVVALSCAKSLDLLCRQIEEFKPEAVSVKDEKDALYISRKYKDVDVVYGMEGLKSIASMNSCDMVLNSLMGMRGLEPTLAAIESGKDIAFANKETLVVGGELVMEAVRRKGVKLLPVDSEHSAIFQSLQGNENNGIKRIILTASGGPFRGYSLKQLEEVTLEQALNHPNWSMGSKITIDSATMMNKGLEVIEAKWLFDVPLEKIQIVVHPQSILHSAVEYMDSSVIGQMGKPDMRVPIAYAFSYPDRLDLENIAESLDFFSLKDGMSFYPADRDVFKTIGLAYEAGEKGGSYPVILNGANEVLVDMFLKGRIKFIDIQNLLSEIMERHDAEYGLDIEGILEADKRIREEVRMMV
ncbi:MAG: 1-deoxy-D-xylulose-5-phosphate reductoisomerase [Anaerovoracaceae bacterium]